MANFMEETNKGLQSLANDFGEDLEIKEVLLVDNEGNAYTQKGGSKIDWDKALKALKRSNWDYDRGYGIQEFGGFITFKKIGMWMSRDEYDGSEWWSYYSEPTLKKWGYR